MSLATTTQNSNMCFVKCWMTMLLFMCLMTTAWTFRKAYSVEELCSMPLLHPTIRLAPRGTFPAAVTLTLSKSMLWPGVLDCSLTLQTPDPKATLGLIFSHLQMRMTNSVECLDYIEVNDGHKSLRICGDMNLEGGPLGPPVPNHFESNAQTVSIHIFSRPNFGLREKSPSLGFWLNVVSYYKAPQQKACASVGGFHCGLRGRCLPRRLVCDGYPDCNEPFVNADEGANCTTFDNDIPPQFLSPAAITVIVAAVMLAVFLAILLGVWLRKRILAKRELSSSNQDLTCSTSDPVVFVIESSTLTSGNDHNGGPGGESIYHHPTAPALSARSSLCFLQPAMNEAPPTYESLFGFTGACASTSLEKPPATRESSDP